MSDQDPRYSWNILDEVAKEQVRLARGDITKTLIEYVHVRCYSCGGVTIFPLHSNQARPTPAPCLHCGMDI